MKISTILDQIDLGSMALPEFQRGYVWNRDQVRGLMDSLFRSHPVGSLLVWVTKTENADSRGDGPLAPGTVELILDGQQRITSLYGIVRGKSPQFFDGNAWNFTGLYFNLKDETFEFYAPLKMKGNPLWIDVTALMQRGVAEVIQQLMALSEPKETLNLYINRLAAVEAIKERDLHIEQVTGEDKTVDVVVNIFNKVNSGGTKLSKGDLALARICAAWPDARLEMKKRLAKWQQYGFYFKLEWFLRDINAIITGEARFTALENIEVQTFVAGLETAEDSVDKLLNLISGRLGLDHDLVLGSRYSFPLLARYLTLRGGHLDDYRERDKLLYWYINTFLWGRYAGSTESVLNQDLEAIEELDGGLDRLLNLLRLNRGDLSINPNDLVGWSKGARFYPLLYMLTRVCHSRDWDTGIELTNHLLGKLSSLQVHHVFPKALLYKHGYSRADVNRIANFTFLTQETNLLISDRDPTQYLEEIALKQPSALESHWIPMDRNLWRIENYHEFLAARRVLIAKAANDFLDSLLKGEVPEAEVASPLLQRDVKTLPGGVSGDDEEQILRDCNNWIVEQGLPAGDYLYELLDPESEAPLAVLDLAWPNGLQEGLSEAVALLLNEGDDTEDAANRAGYRYFTNIDEFYAYVQREILAISDQATR